MSPVSGIAIGPRASANTTARRERAEPARDEGFAEELGAREEAPTPRRVPGRERKELATANNRRGASRPNRAENADEDVDAADGAEERDWDSGSEGDSGEGGGSADAQLAPRTPKSSALPDVTTASMLAMFGFGAATAAPARVPARSTPQPSKPLPAITNPTASKPPPDLDTILAEAGASIRVEVLPEAVAAAAPEFAFDEEDGESPLPDAPLPHMPSHALDSEATFDAPTILPPEAPTEIKEHAPLPHAIAVHVRDPDGDWRVDVSRHADNIDLMVHASADIHHILRDAERDLRNSFQDMGQTMGTMDFTQHDSRDSQAKREDAPAWPTPAKRRASAETSRPAGLLDRRA